MSLYLAKCADPLKIIGPDIPKCVNTISPKSSYINFFRSESIILIPTFLKLNPCNLLHSSFSYTSNGTNDGFIGVIICPKSFAILYPSPVEPVNG